MDDFLYKIKRLDCSYHLSNGMSNKPEVRTVLSVNNLIIPCNKITFILGSSGSGKSTFMEAVGLMSNTINIENSKEVYYRQSNGEVYDLVEEVKNQKRIKHLDSFRFDNFSFIFQATNLMANFSAKENVALTDYINYPIIAEFFALKRLEEILKIPDTFEDNPGDYSGGQRQRFAFARALGARANVLFGDEPTGNLDEINSNDVLKILQEIIKENVKDEGIYGKIRSAVIVSHSVELALKFADQIVIIIAPESLERKNDDNEPKSNSNVSCVGKTNNLFVYKRGKVDWQGNKSQVRVKKEISFFLNYELVQIHKEFVNISELLMNNSESLETNYLNFHKFIKMFIEHFYDADEREIKKVENISVIIKDLRMDTNLDSDSFNSIFNKLQECINNFQ